MESRLAHAANAWRHWWAKWYEEDVRDLLAEVDRLRARAAGVFRPNCLGSNVSRTPDTTARTPN